MALILSGDTGPSFVQSAAMPAGSVIQVVNTTTQNGSSAYYSTSSGTLSSTGLSVSITPRSTSNKVFLTLTAPIETSTGGCCAGFTIYRNGTNLATGTSPSGYILRSAAGYLDSVLSLQFLDSPSANTSCTYTIYMNSAGGTSSLGTGGGNINSYPMCFTAMEIQV